MATVFSDEIEVSNQNWFVTGPSIDGVIENLTMPLSVEPDHLWLNTGTNLGEVTVVINLLDAEPGPAEGWEQVNDSEFDATEGSLMVCGGMGSWHGDFEIAPGRYHVRYYEKNVRQAADNDPLPPGDSPVDSYQLDIWPV